MVNNQFDIRELPSWKYFAWGILNGIFLGISLKHSWDISETGIMAQVIGAFKPLFQSANLSTGWITALIFLLGLIGILSTIVEVYAIYQKGWPARIIALCGFISILFIILGLLTNFAALVLVAGVLFVAFFPNE